MATFRRFMVKNFLGYEGVKLATLGKNGKFKRASTFTWLKVTPRIFFLLAIYGIEKIIMDGLFTFWDIPFILAIIFCVWGGFIYSHTNPLKIEEMNDVERNNHLLYK